MEQRVEVGARVSERTDEARGDPYPDDTGSWWSQASLSLVNAAAVVVANGCSTNPVAAAAPTSERAHSVALDSEVDERVEDCSGR